MLLWIVGTSEAISRY